MPLSEPIERTVVCLVDKYPALTYLSGFTDAGRLFFSLILILFETLKEEDYLLDYRVTCFDVSISGFIA
jgi:hypothetical protein